MMEFGQNHRLLWQSYDLCSHPHFQSKSSGRTSKSEDRFQSMNSGCGAANTLGRGAKVKCGLEESAQVKACDTNLGSWWIW